MATRICVLKQSKEYAAAHVQWLAKQVPDLVCVSDVPVKGVETIKMPNNWPSWWCKMNLFDPNLISDDLLYLDLDTVAFDLEGFDIGVSTMLSDFYKPRLPASGLMFIKHEDKAAVWQEWIKKPHYHMARCTTRERWGDQGFLKDVFKAQRWQDVLPGRVVSYKVHCKTGVPEGASIVCFHGQPRPWQVNNGWVPAW